MERYWMAKKALLNIPVIEGALPPDTFTQVVLYADAQRALDAEREKVKRLKKRLAEEHPGLDEVCDERDALRAQLRQVEGERDEWERKCRGLCQAHGVLLIEHHDMKKDLTTLRQLVEVHTKQLTELTIIPIGCSREQELRWTQSIKDLRATLAAQDAGKHHEVD